MIEFVAVDGEATEDGRYFLLCASTGEVLHNPDGISTRQAFKFLLALARPRRVLVCFGLNYDANQWLEGIGLSELAQLWETGTATIWHRWRVDWTPGKSFAVKDRKTGAYVKVCESFGFFQSSFIKALRAWGLEPSAELEEMKRRRGRFTAGELERIIGYCKAECRLLVTLMERLADACAEAGCLPASWIGAGSIAAALLRSHGVKAHHAYDADIAPQEVVAEAILGAYFGGRIELFAQGIFERVHTRDLRSAYPHAALALPSLDGASVRWRRRYKADLKQAIWRVAWQDAGALAPFPVRQADASIHYPASGSGCYHAVEVAAALALGYPIQIIEGWQLVGRERAEPFEWIPSVYAHRASLKAAGHPAEKALKLGLNSVYGKLAQGYGARPFQSYWWAGYITAATRARVLQQAAGSRGLLMISTDGVFSLRPPSCGSARPTLGSWEPGEFADLFTAQPGVYHGRRDGEYVSKTRGFPAREINYGRVREGWESAGPEHVYFYDCTRFIGAGVALQRRRPDQWRRWIRARRSLSLMPERKGVEPENGHYRLTAPAGPLDSVPYTPKQSLYDIPESEQELMIGSDQPMRED